MPPLSLLVFFFGGLFLMNAVPHLISGSMGRKFPSPFAKPRGRGQSSALVNVLWGVANLVVAYLLLCKVARLDPDSVTDMIAFGAGVLLMGVFHARHFGSLNEGRGPNLS